jgi:hypothetical protein
MAIHALLSAWTTNVSHGFAISHLIVWMYSTHETTQFPSQLSSSPVTAICQWDAHPAQPDHPVNHAIFPHHPFLGQAIPYIVRSLVIPHRHGPFRLPAYTESHGITLCSETSNWISSICLIFYHLYFYVANLDTPLPPTQV